MAKYNINMFILIIMIIFAIPQEGLCLRPISSRQVSETFKTWPEPLIFLAIEEYSQDKIRRLSEHGIVASKIFFLTSKKANLTADMELNVSTALSKRVKIPKSWLDKFFARKETKIILLADLKNPTTIDVVRQITLEGKRRKKDCEIYVPCAKIPPWWDETAYKEFEETLNAFKEVMHSLGTCHAGENATLSDIVFSKNYEYVGDRGAFYIHLGFWGNIEFLAEEIGVLPDRFYLKGRSEQHTHIKEAEEKYRKEHLDPYSVILSEHPLCPLEAHPFESGECLCCIEPDENKLFMLGTLLGIRAHGTRGDRFYNRIRATKGISPYIEFHTLFKIATSMELRESWEHFIGRSIGQLSLSGGRYFGSGWYGPFYAVLKKRYSSRKVGVDYGDFYGTIYNFDQLEAFLVRNEKDLQLFIKMIDALYLTQGGRDQRKKNLIKKKVMTYEQFLERKGTGKFVIPIKRLQEAIKYLPDDTTIVLNGRSVNKCNFIKLMGQMQGKGKVQATVHLEKGEIVSVTIHTKAPIKTPKQTFDVCA